MKRIEFQTIGFYEVISNKEYEVNRFIKINIKNEMKDALIKLNHFSHCILFTKDDKEIFCYSAKILEINEKNGEMIIESSENNRYEGIQGDLVDIKPYFPCEEVIEYKNSLLPIQPPIQPPPIPFKGDPIGEYLFANHSGFIQLREIESLSASEIEKSLNGIMPGSYIRVSLIWFHPIRQ